MDLRWSPEQEVITCHCAVFKRDRRPIPRVHIAKDYWARSLHSSKSCSPLCPQGLTQCLAHHFTSISKGFLREVMTKEQLTFPVLLQLVPCPAEPILNSLTLKTWLQTLFPGLRQENYGQEKWNVSPQPPKNSYQSLKGLIDISNGTPDLLTSVQLLKTFSNLYFTTYFNMLFWLYHENDGLNSTEIEYYIPICHILWLLIQ